MKEKNEKSRLYQLRKDLEVCQVDIAEDTDINVKSYSRYEKNPYDMPVWAFKRLADYFDVPMEDLLQEPKSENNFQYDILHKVMKMDIKRCKVVLDFIRLMENNEFFSK